MNIYRRHCRFSVLLIALIFHCIATACWVSNCRAEDGSDAKPNIVFILADDLGWPDVGFNGNQFYQTPNIDLLASNGMVFSNAYTGGPNCAPTRACLMTGMYGPRTNIWTPGARSKGKLKHMKFLVPNKQNKQGDDVFKSVESLSPDVTSLAEVLKPAGYVTARFGKWHLGEDTQGFDQSSWSGRIKEDYPKQGTGYSDIENSITITDAGIRFIETNKDRPFFLYLAHFEVHTPLKADPAVTKKYKQKLESKAWEEKWKPTYAAMIEAVDNSVGRVQDKLQQLGLSENTIVIFSSDNGGLGGVTPMKPLRGAKGSLYEGGIRVPTCIRWPKEIAAGSTCPTPITSVDFMPTFAELSGGQLPTNQPVDGTSFVPLIKGGTLPPRAIFWHYPLYLSGQNPLEKFVPIAGTKRLHWRASPCSVIRRGDWKLIHYLDDDRVELFNLADDRSEENNLADSNSEKATALLEELNQWRQETKAPMPTQLNPAFVKK